MRFPAAVAAFCLLLAGTSPPTDLAAHRALYNLTMDPGRSGDIVAASGTMGYEVTDACDGWAVRQRLDMTVTNHDGQDIQMVSDYATWELKDGLAFRFHMKQMTDSAVTSETDGEAKLVAGGGSGEAHYTTPGQDVKPLPAGTLFPMAHTEAILAAARSGKKFLNIPLFDGTVDGGAQDSFVTVIKWDTPAQSKWPELSSLPSARVRISFFDHDKECADTRLSGRDALLGERRCGRACRWISASS